MRFDLSDEEWTLLGRLIPKCSRSARPDLRKIINAIIYALSTGGNRLASLIGLQRKS
jgi:transposase